MEYLEALAHFKEHQTAIEADIWQQIHGHTIPPRMLAAANYHFGRNIEASLALGNMEYIDSDLDWLEGLLTSHVGMPMEFLDQYLLVYLHALENRLDSRGAPIVHWLEGVVQGDHSQRRAVQLSHRNARTR